MIAGLCSQPATCNNINNINMNVLLSLSSFWSRVCNRLNLGKWSKYPSYWMVRVGVKPKVNFDSVQEADTFLQSLHPDPASSALCHNKVISPAEYDLQVVIPVYKVEQFLDACLQSVLEQKTKYKFHIVAVDDGSPDKCGEILTKYEADNRLSVIRQQNRGLSGARNSGMSIINARYVTFLDSDDMLAQGAIEKLLDAAYKHNADIVEGSYKRRTVRGKLWGGETALYEGISSRKSLTGYPWMKVIKAELLKNIHFPERYWYEDTIMGMLIIPLAKRVALIKDNVYYYTYNKDSISFVAAKNPKNIDGIYITRSLLSDAKQCGALEAAPDYQYHHYLQQIRNNRCRSLWLGPDIELAMFIISCDLWSEYFSSGYVCSKPNLKNMELALKNRDFNLFRKTCYIDF